MNKCTSNSKDLESHFFPSLISIFRKGRFMCRECIFQRCYCYFIILRQSSSKWSFTGQILHYNLAYVVLLLASLTKWANKTLRRFHIQAQNQLQCQGKKGLEMKTIPLLDLLDSFLQVVSLNSKKILQVVFIKYVSSWMLAWGVFCYKVPQLVICTDQLVPFKKLGFLRSRVHIKDTALWPLYELRFSCFLLTGFNPTKVEPEAAQIELTCSSPIK
jgi:hypothetical protein